MKTPGFLIAIALLLVSIHPATAQEKPYEPRSFSRTDLIHLGNYKSPPLEFPYPVLSTTQVAVGSRFDFRIVYDVPFADFIAVLAPSDTPTEVAQISAASLAANHSDLSPDKRGLRVFGRQIHQTPQRYVLGSDHVVHRFVIDVSPAGSQTTVQMRSAIFGQLFGGVVPSRSPFAPIGAKPVSLRWQ